MKISTPHKLLQVIALACIFIFLNAKNVVRISEPLDGRLVENISSNWQYLEHNLEEIAELKKQENWIPISIPHTWNRWDAVDMTPGYRRDASWYQKEMYIKDYGNAQYVLYFEGSNISTDVYVNEQYAGSHIGGYVGFEIDITEQVKKGLKNTISIRVDNSYNRDIIPSQKSDFFIYGGITRDVWLKILPPVNIKKVRISTPEVSVQKASTTLKLDIHRADLLNEDFLIKAKIREKQSGKIVASTTTNGTDIKENNTIRLPEINRPKLWSPKNPQLYEMITELWKGNTKIDEKTERLGYRWYEFEANGGFFLNGERLLLRGTHRHEEHAGYGAAMTNAMHRKDIEQMKDLGVNFLRLGHYPQDPEVYKTCDELGIIVWDELPWCRGGMGGETWKENTENLLTEQIIQNYNHPSIFFWSLGNEIYWLPDFENGDDEACLNAFVKQLNDLAHELDPYRLTSIRKYYAGADLVDVFSPSIWSGWYAGVYTNYKNTILKNQQKYPRFLHMEYGGSSHVGRHTENPITGDGTLNEDDWAEVSNQVGIKNIAKTGDWTENYIVDLFDWYLGVSETLDNFSGNAQWAFKDFGTPLRPENAIPYINQKGL
ncbi:MAG: glycoside hydrolase family 2 TIM barrel-domain containing protein, partial [Bacteroidota bacterium]